ncbi:hypothetical protein [Thalassotalea mangrovi]|uniref:Uncharacterized protein n=1 Tax=Thalassotalea mangrovi TaxID=2572245 RepID=A0A4U1B8Q9_9GAMM|nr:hypothetical protein [Thalassotalea mangrovi]TKB47079.1 hypothetical protein E8M12_02140 [Thalassotalea mangrovi]
MPQPIIRFTPYLLPFILALTVHGIILWLLLPKPAAIIENKRLPLPAGNIDSYLYRPTPSLKVDSKTDAANSILEQAPETEIKPLKPMAPKSSVVGKKEFLPAEQKSPGQRSLSPENSQNASKQASAKARFNPYQGLAEINQQKDLQASGNPYRNSRGYSVFQQLPEPVPKSLISKSDEQVRRENTSIVGHETIEKRDGYCYQETDLSFINDEFGKVASISACGESSDERYFREFMKTKLKKAGNR